MSFMAQLAAHRASIQEAVSLNPIDAFSSLKTAPCETDPFKPPLM